MILRDFKATLSSEPTLEAVFLIGPRQVGKSTLLEQMKVGSHLVLDDLGLRERLQKDPALVLEGVKLPCLIDEAQYAPNLFPEIKLRIDKLRKLKREEGTSYASPLFYLTGSNRTLLDEKVKESLAGRSNLFVLLGLSVKEVLGAFKDLPLKTVLFRGGFPELYTRPELKVHAFLNDYIISFVEKDIAVSAGIEKVVEFHAVLRLLAARTGQFLNMTEVSGAAGVDQKTVQSWVGILQRNLILQLLPTYSSNLSSRIIKMPKLYFYDTGLCTRLQGHLDEEQTWYSSQMGALFETLVFSEIRKTIFNFLKPWELYSWRTKEQKEIDFVLETGKETVFIEAKFGIQNISAFELDSEAKKVFRGRHRKLVVTAGGELTSISKDTTAVPIAVLAEYLLGQCQ